MVSLASIVKNDQKVKLFQSILHSDLEVHVKRVTY